VTHTPNPETTMLDHDAIEARANAATLGPWTVSRSSSHPGERHIEAGLGAGVYVAMDVAADDASFIATARADIPALVAQVRVLEAERDELAATLANERGEGAPPSEGWWYDDNSCVWLWSTEPEGETNDWLVEVTSAGDWIWQTIGGSGSGKTGTPTKYARAAMRAADIARGAT